MMSLEPMLVHDTAGRALNRARLMKLLRKEWELRNREGKPYRGLTYGRTRTIFQIEYGYIPTIGNRYRELKQLGWVTIQKDPDDGLNHVYPSEETMKGWQVPPLVRLFKQ